MTNYSNTPFTVFTVFKRAVKRDRSMTTASRSRPAVALSGDLDCSHALRLTAGRGSLRAPSGSRTHDLVIKSHPL